MREILKVKQKVRVSRWAVEDTKFDVYTAIQERLLREALLGTLKEHPDKVVTAISVVFLVPSYHWERSKAGVLYEWYDCGMRTAIEIADLPEAGMFSKTPTFF